MDEKASDFPKEIKVNLPPKPPLNSLSAISEQQLKVYDLYFNLGYSQKQIACSLKISKGRVSQIVRLLREKGAVREQVYPPKLFSMPIPITPLNSPTPISCGTQRYWRLHDLHFIAEPYYFYPKYAQAKKGFGIPYGKWTVTFNEKNIEYQLQKLESFDSKDIDECRRLAQESLNKVITETGERYGFEVFKDKKCNIKLVNHHFAEVENGVAVINKGKKIKIFGTDGKVWLVIDKSTGKPELETVHPVMATDDAKLMDKYYNDLRNNDPPTNSELEGFIYSNAKQVSQINDVMVHLDKNLKTHFRVLNGIEKAVLKLDKTISKGAGRFLSQPSGQHSPQQSSLLDYGGF